MEPSGRNSPVKCPSSPSVKTSGKRVMTPNKNQSCSLISVDKSTSHRQSKSPGNIQTNENIAPCSNNDKEKNVGKEKSCLVHTAEKRPALFTKASGGSNPRFGDVFTSSEWRSKDELIKASCEKEWKTPPSCMENSMLPENVSARLVDSMSKLTIYAQLLAQLGEASEDKEDVPVVSKKRKFKEGSGKERGKRKRVTFSDEVRTIKYPEPEDGTASKDDAEDQRNEDPHTKDQRTKKKRTKDQHSEVRSAPEVQRTVDGNMRKTRSRLLLVAMHGCRASTSRDEHVDGHEPRPC